MLWTSELYMLYIFHLSKWQILLQFLYFYCYNIWHEGKNHIFVIIAHKRSNIQAFDEKSLTSPRHLYFTLIGAEREFGVVSLLKEVHCLWEEGQININD